MHSLLCLLASRGGATGRYPQLGLSASRRQAAARHAHGMDWRALIEEAVHGHGGLATRQQLLERVPREVLDSYIGRSHLVRMFPRVYRLRDGRADDFAVLRAALRHTGPVAALSHTTALAVWGVRELEQPLHLTVDQSIKRAGAPGLIVHRRLRFDPKSTQCVERRADSR